MIRPARTWPERRDDVKLLVVDPREGSFVETRTGALPSFFAPGDLLVVNDAATVPASLRGVDSLGRTIEARLVAQIGSASFRAVLFGDGDWRTRTEDRPAPPALEPGHRVRFGALAATVFACSDVSARLVDLRFDHEGDELWRALYAEGRPVQYSHLAHELPLWAVQTVYAGRPFAFEMPSAGRPLSWETLLALRRQGVGLASLSHAAGLSATGDPALDRALPLPERFDIPATTAQVVARTRAAGGRVIAVGTTVVRALEGSAWADGFVRAGPGETSLRIGAGFIPRVVDGILSGVHEPTESHFNLLAAFTSPELLRSALGHAERAGFLSHELGDAMLMAPGVLRGVATTRRLRSTAREAAHL